MNGFEYAIDDDDDDDDVVVTRSINGAVVHDITILAKRIYSQFNLMNSQISYYTMPSNVVFSLKKID